MSSRFMQADPRSCALDIHLSPSIQLFALRYRNTNNLDILLGPLLIHLRILNLMHDIHARNRAPENRMLVVEPGLFHAR